MAKISTNHEELVNILKQKELYKNLVSDLSIAMWRWDLKSGKLNSFFGLDTLLGYQDHDQFKEGDFWKNIWHPEDRIQILEDVRKCTLAKCTELSIINRIQHADGHYVWFYSKLGVHYHDDGEVSLIGVSINLDKLQDTLNALNLEKETYQTFLKATKAATWVWNVQTGETTFDDAWAEILGYTLDELQPISIRTWVDLVNPEDIEIANRALQTVFDKKTDFYNTTFRMKHKEGYDVWISDRGKVISWTEDGKPLVMVGTHIDVSSYKDLEEEIREREKHFKYLVENSYDIIFSLDLEGKMTYLSPAWERLLGFTVDDTMHVAFRPYVHPEDLPRLEVFFDQMYKNKNHDAFEGYRLLTKNGDYRWFNMNASALTDDEGHVIGFTGTARYITGRKRLQEQISRERDLFRKTLLSVADAVVSTNQEGKIVVINPQAQKLLGYTEEEAMGKYLLDIAKIYVDEQRNGLALSMESLIQQTEETFISNATLLNRIGKTVMIELSIAPIKDYQYINEGVVMVFRDISDKVRKQKEIEFLSYHDFLTGLYNRRYMDQIILDLDKDRYLPLGIMILDLNDLKEMNDQHGHHSGDELLKKVSRILESSIHAKDVLGRIGGDEFLILVPNTSVEDMYRLKHHLIQSFDNESITGRKISVALGYSIKMTHDQNVFEVMREADDFMYAHKEGKANID